MNTKAILTPATSLVLLTSVLFCPTALESRPALLGAQGRPIVRDTTAGEVKETHRQPTGVERSPVGSTKSSRPAYSVLIVFTEPEGADVSINGESAAKAVNGTLKTELRSGQKYKVVVSAGPDYEPFSQSVTLKRGKYEVVKALLKAKYGVLKIFPAIDGAKILVDGEPAPANKLDASKENGITLNGLTPGDHKLTYDLTGYVLYERNFKISPGSEYTWSLVPERAVTEMTVITDPKVVVYVDGKQAGTTPANGRLNYTAELGSHQVKLVKEDYEEYTTTKEFKYHEPVTVDKKLVPLPTSAEFSDDFDVPKPDLWTMPPSGITFKEGRLQLENATSLGSPTNIRYRDFEMSFHLKLTGGGGAAWAVRVKDSGNYYLFYLSGPDGKFPNRFITYIVRNNEFDPNKFFHSDNLSERLTAGGQYEIVIKATGNKIEHQITPANTGKPTPLGVLDDPNSTFLLGGIGFRTVASERFSIDDLFVHPR
jgi:hypothetical protein